MLKDSCFCEDDNNGGGYVSPLRVYSVEKLEKFLNRKIIFDITNFIN